MWYLRALNSCLWACSDAPGEQERPCYCSSVFLDVRAGTSLKIIDCEHGNKDLMKLKLCPCSRKEHLDSLNINCCKSACFKDFNGFNTCGTSGRVV